MHMECEVRVNEGVRGEGECLAIERSVLVCCIDIFHYLIEQQIVYLCTEM